MDNLDSIVDKIRDELDRIDTAREQAYKRSRDLTRICARTIRAVHREEWEKAAAMLGEADEVAAALVSAARQHPALYSAGYTQDALKEYVEAYVTVALLRHAPLPTPTQLDVEPATWLNGLAEAATELRRCILDLIRHRQNGEAELLLDAMDTIYTVLLTFDFSDSITRGLRRRTDTVRAVLERTRGDVTTSLRQSQLEDALAAVETRLRDQT